MDDCFTSANRQFDGVSDFAGPAGYTWKSRGYLPHFDGPELTQHITMHLGDSLPVDIVKRLDDELQMLPREKQDIARRKRVDAWLDAAHGSCILRDPAAAMIVQEALFFFDGVRYQLSGWVVMPNHVHVLFTPKSGWAMAKTIWSWKKYTAARIVDYLRAKDNSLADNERFWHREYWDRFMRDERHFAQTMEYIHHNPVKARLVARAEEWRWSSAWTGRNAVQEA